MLDVEDLFMGCWAWVNRLWGVGAPRASSGVEGPVAGSGDVG